MYKIVRLFCSTSIATMEGTECIFFRELILSVFYFVNILIHSNDVDMIVWSLFENGYKQCGDTPIGTYVTTVPNFLNGLMNQKAQDVEDQGQDFDYPDVAQYIACIAYEINNQNYYLQFGCSDETSQVVAVNVFDDNACTKPSSVDRSALSDLDVSSIQVRASIQFLVKVSINYLTSKN